MRNKPTYLSHSQQNKPGASSETKPPNAVSEIAAAPHLVLPKAGMVPSPNRGRICETNPSRIHDLNKSARARRTKPLPRPKPDPRQVPSEASSRNSNRLKHTDSSAAALEPHRQRKMRNEPIPSFNLKRRSVLSSQTKPSHALAGSHAGSSAEQTEKIRNEPIAAFKPRKTNRLSVPKQSPENSTQAPRTITHLCASSSRRKTRREWDHMERTPT
jgi:hypothetical protein